MTADPILEYFDVCFGNGAGKLHIACGWGGHRNGTGKYEHDSWVQSHFDYPAERDQAARELLQSSAAGADTYVCPYLMHGEKRHRAGAVARLVVHADVDVVLSLEKILGVGGCAILSGTPGHTHVYVQLTTGVPNHHHTQLERALVAYLGGDPAKISDNDVLRPPDTLNYKPTTEGKDPAPVLWLIRPTEGIRTDPYELAKIFGITLLEEVPSPSIPMSAIDIAEPLSLAHCPDVLAAVSRITGDRSVDTARIIGACYDSHLTRSQTRWVVSIRKDLAQRLAERRDDDVGITWDKIDTDRRRKAQLNFWGAGPATVTADVVIDDSTDALEVLEGGFWDSRDSLQAIWTTALARFSSPWAVLACCVARALTQVRPCVELPHLINRGSLNWFGAITAGSSGGKGAASFTAAQLVPDTYPVNIGSGEGLVAAYGKTFDDGTAEREAIMFNVDEVDMLSAMTARTASTTMGILRSGFSGEAIGFSYAAKDKRRRINAGKYRMTLILSVQPERAGGLFGDAGGGTPQRFMWFPGTDRRIRLNAPWPCGELKLPDHDEWQYPREITLPDVAKQLILEERVKGARGETDALDGHTLFSREKFAYGLAILDGRVEMTLEDWELSGIATNVSAFTRRRVQDELAWTAERDARERGKLRGVENWAAKREAEHDHPLKMQKRFERVSASRLEKVTAAGADGILNRDLYNSTAHRDRDIYDDVVNNLVGTGQIIQIVGTTRWAVP